MGLRQQIEEALSRPFRPGDQEYLGLGVWHNGPTLEESWIKISRELNTDSGTLLPDGRWVATPDPSAITVIDILDETGKKGTGKGSIGDIKKLKDRFNSIIRALPPGKYGMNADHPTKAKKYIREFLKHPWFEMSGEQAGAKIFDKKTQQLEHVKFDTMNLNVPDDATAWKQPWDTQGVSRSSLTGIGEDGYDAIDIAKRSGYEMSDDIVDLSHLTRKKATKEAKRLGVTQYKWKDGQVITKYGGDRWVTADKLETRRARERRGGSEELKQIRKEETRIADKNRFRSATPDELDEIAQMRLEASLEGKDLDHIYGQSYYSKESEGLGINSPKNRAKLDPTLNRGIKKAQEQGFSQHMLEMELRNPSRSMPLEETLDFATHKPHYYEDVINKNAIAGPVSELTAPVVDNTVQVRRALDDPSIAKHLGKNAGDVFKGATLFGIPLVGFLGEGVKAATRVASALPGEYTTFGLWKGLDVAVANWSRQDYEEARRQYDLNPTEERKEDLDYATRALGFDTGSVFDPTMTSDIGGIANLLSHPGLRRALGTKPEESTYVSEWRYD